MSAAVHDPWGGSPAGLEVTLGVSCAGGQLAADVDATVTLDGRLIGVGSVWRGFDVKIETNAGVHQLQLQWSIFTQRFALYFPLPGVYQAELRFSKFWGKFFPVDGRDQE